MTIPRQPQPAKPKAPAGNAQRANETNTQADKQSDDLDEALDESFPASDPVAVSITSIDPRATPKPAP